MAFGPLVLAVFSLLMPVADATPIPPHARQATQEHNAADDHQALYNGHSAAPRQRRHHRRRVNARHPKPDAPSALTSGHQSSSSTQPALVFGIYPGGAAGTVGPSGPIKPEHPAKRLTALETLRAPGHPFLIHLYASYTGAAGWSAASQLGSQISQYTAAGFQVEAVLTYRPAGGGSKSDVTGFTQFARAAVRAFGADRGFVSLQVTNEANIGGAPNAADGYYAGAKDALIKGVIAAKAEARVHGFGQVRVGFNWAYDTGSGETTFWKYLAKGGSAFVSSLDWVGLDAYPGTWGPPIAGDLWAGTIAAIDTALSSLRQRYMPLAGIPARVALHVSENGYPTGPGRTQLMQKTAVEAAVTAVNAARAKYNVSHYCWFDLRDNDSASNSFEDQYGLMSDDYAPKSAFTAYRDLVASLS